MNIRPSPYIGPRPFQAGEKMYGRDRELTTLRDLLIAERIVLLYSPSGAGKTSLIQAGLLPLMRADDFDVLPVVRVSAEPPQDLTGPNRYVFSVTRMLDDGLPPAQRMTDAQLALLTLDAYLTRRPQADDAPSSQLLIFDQFEEVLTVDPTNIEAKRAFFEQVGAALHKKNRWALFSMREDYRSALDPYTRPIPKRFSTTFRLNLLNAEAARQSLQEPTRSVGVSFNDEAANELINDLRRTQVQQSDGTITQVLGPFVEPVQLQVVGLRLWQNLADDDVEITREDIAAMGDVNNVLADYYADSARRTAEQTRINERAIREWFDRQLITAQGIRGQVLLEPQRSRGLDNSAIRALEHTHLIRAEERHGSTWFELAHDRLIEPVRKNNAAWFEANLSVLQRQADLWHNQGRQDGLLLRDQALTEAEQWATAHDAELTAVEREFLQRCREVREVILRARRQQKRIRQLAIAASVVSVIAFIALIGALMLFVQARNEGERANTEANNASQARNTAVSESTRALNAQATAVAESTRALNAQATAVGEAERAVNARSTAQANEVKAVTAQAKAESALIAQATANAGANNALATAQAQEVIANQQRAKAEAEQKIGFSRELASQALSNLDIDPELSLLLAIEAYTVANTVEAADALRQAIVEARAPAVVGRHDAGVNSVAFSPDGKFIVTASNDNTARVWNAASGAEQLTLRGHGGFVYDAAYSPDGKLIATASSDGTARVWDAVSGREVLVVRQQRSVRSVVYSPDGKYLLTASDDETARLWDALSGRELLVLRGREREINDARFSADGRMVVTAHEDGQARVWEVSSALASPSATASSARGVVTFDHNTPVKSAAFSPDGKLVVTTNEDEFGHVWEIATGRELLVLRGHGAPVRRAAFSPDGKTIVTTSADGTARVWEVSTTLNTGAVSGREQRILSGHTGIVTSAAFNREGTSIVTVSDDRTVRLWEVTINRDLMVLKGHSSGVNQIVFSANGQLAATASADTTVRVWETASGRELRTLQGHTRFVNSVDFSPNGQFLLTGSDDHTARVWSMTSGQTLLTLKGHLAAINSAVFSPDGSSPSGDIRLATASDDSVARVWNVTAALTSGAGASEVAALQGHTGGINDIAYSPNGRQLVTGSADKTVRVWDATSGRSVRVLQGHKDAVTSVAFSRDGRFIVSASTDLTVRVWDASSGNTVAVLHGHTQWINSATFSPDGKYIISASDDRTARIWEVASQSAIATLRGHTSAIKSATYSPDGQFIATASFDKTARISRALLEDLLTVARARVKRALTCLERQAYLHEGVACE
jgi:WD40 repeat protein